MKLKKEAEKIAELAKVDFWNIQKKDKDARTPLLRIAIHGLVVGAIVVQYALLDEVLSVLACKYFFKGRRFIMWRTKKFQVFNHYILDEMYLLKKMEMVHAITPLPKKVGSTIHRVNSIRNAMAHSFFPENRKEFKKIGKVLYSGKDMRTADVACRLPDSPISARWRCRRTG